MRRETRLACRVVSVGSLVAGGAATTDTAALYARELAARGYRVAIASPGRGGRRRERVAVVSDGRRVCARPGSVGPAALLLAARAPRVPVLVGADPVQVGLRALSLFGCGVLVFHDGFQQHALWRDLDVVSLDGSHGLGNRRVRPRGPLREPATAIRYAHVVQVVDGPLPAPDEESLASWCPGAVRARARRVPVGVRPLAGGSRGAASGLRGARLGVLATPGQLGWLRRALEDLGAAVVAERRLPSRRRPRPADLAGLAREAPRWITTELDALALPAPVGGASVAALEVALAVDEPIGLFDRVEARLR